MHYNVFLFYFVNYGLQNPILNFLTPLISTLSEVTGWGVLIVIMLIFGNTKTKKLALWALLILIIVELVVAILKGVIAEPRPFMTLANVHVLEMETGYSMPSAHATLSFALGIFLGSICKIKTKLFKNDAEYREISTFYLFLGFAIVVAFSRVYMGVHYPFDVFVGGILGSLIGIIMLKLYKKYGSVNLRKYVRFLNKNH